MAVPSRIYFVITLFALVVTLLTVPYAAVVLTCDPGTDTRLPGLACSQFSLGAKLFLTLASLFTLAFTVMSWRALRAGARRDATRRRDRAMAAQVAQEAPNRAAARAREREEPGPPPGYH